MENKERRPKLKKLVGIKIDSINWMKAMDILAHAPLKIYRNDNLVFVQEQTIDHLKQKGLKFQVKI